MSRRKAITGVILAGGQGSRLQRRDKDLIDFNGRPLIEQTLERLRPQVDEILISANRDLSGSLDGYPAGGDRKAMLRVDRRSPVRVDFSASPELFETVNTPQRYARIQHIGEGR